MMCAAFFDATLLHVLSIHIRIHGERGGRERVKVSAILSLVNDEIQVCPTAADRQTPPQLHFPY